MAAKDRQAERTAASSSISLVSLSLLALVVGIVTGLGAVLFRDLIGLIHNLFFLGKFSLHYDANLFTPASPWGPLVVLVPVVGAVIVTFLVSNFAPEAKGHGVPEVMDAIYYGGGIIRPAVAVVKSLASAVAIGSGSAVGREGPIIQIGSALGSTLGQLIRMPPGQRIILVAAGAGAGIAATFNTPIGGVMFTIELMMPEVSVSSFLPVALSTAVATFVGRLFFGVQPAFEVPHLTPLSNDFASAETLALYAVLGLLTGIAATAFVRGLHFAEDLFDKIGHRYLRHVLGMALVGLLMLGLFETFGHYYVEGVGYATIQAILVGNLYAPGLLFLLFFCKLFATSVSLGSGSSGGIFSPSLFLGATIGGGFAALLVAAHLPIPIDVAVLRHGRHGRDGGQRHRRRHDRGCDDLRDDAQLRHRPADDPRRRGRRGNPPHAVAREHVHHEAVPAGPCRAEGAACQHVPGPPRRGGDGHGRARRAGQHELRGAPGAPRQPGTAASCRGHAGPPHQQA